MLSMDIGRKDITIQHFTSQDIIDKDITSQDVGIAYHYCDFSDPKSLETRTILGTIIRQLLEGIAISSDLEQQMDQFYRSDTRTIADDELVALLFAVAKHFSKLYVFIDGLDECRKEEQITILSIVNQLAQPTRPAVKTLIASREEAIISTSLRDIPRLRISADKNSADIAFFVEETVKANISSGALTIQDPSLESNIISALINGAKGM
jgi:KAP family P-loop domain